MTLFVSFPPVGPRWHTHTHTHGGQLFHCGCEHWRLAENVRKFNNRKNKTTRKTSVHIRPDLKRNLSKGPSSSEQCGITVKEKKQMQLRKDSCSDCFNWNEWRDGEQCVIHRHCGMHFHYAASWARRMNEQNTVQRRVGKQERQNCGRTNSYCCGFTASLTPTERKRATYRRL
jgi:hypothetical protein